MSFSNPFFITALIVLLVLIVVGVIVILVMKKKNASEKARSIAGVSVVFAGLLLSGLLVYMITMNMMYDLVAQKRYTEFTFHNPDKSRQLVIQEYSSANETGFDVYFNDKKLGEVTTDHYLPFSKDEIQVDWEDDEVVIYYTYQSDDDSYLCKSCRVDLKNGTVSRSVTAEKNLSKSDEDSSAPSAA